MMDKTTRVALGVGAIVLAGAIAVAVIAANQPTFPVQSPVAVQAPPSHFDQWLQSLQTEGAAHPEWRGPSREQVEAEAACPALRHYAELQAETYAKDQAEATAAGMTYEHLRTFRRAQILATCARTH
jgi:hypothetical protein